MSEHIYEDSNIEHERYHVIPFGSMREEIVRCRDCVYFDKYGNDEISVCYRFDNEQPIVESDGFCAWGERRDV